MIDLYLKNDSGCYKIEFLKVGENTISGLLDIFIDKEFKVENLKNCIFINPIIENITLWDRNSSEIRITYESNNKEGREKLLPPTEVIKRYIELLNLQKEYYAKLQ